MNRLFLDTEFNGERGELISMALVPSEGDREFYEVLRMVEPRVDPFVAEHVLPVLDKEPVHRLTFRNKLAEYLRGFHKSSLVGVADGSIVVADWPADFEHLCAVLSEIGAAGGYVETIPLYMQLVNTPKLNSRVPHNALSDARALREWWWSSHCVSATKENA